MNREVDEIPLEYNRVSTDSSIVVSRAAVEIACSMRENIKRERVGAYAELGAAAADEEEEDEDLEEFYADEQEEETSGWPLTLPPVLALRHP